MTANAITTTILGQHWKHFPGSRLFRRNIGRAYGVDAVNAIRAALRAGSCGAALGILNRARPIEFGMPGEPDCDGFLSITTGNGTVLGIRIGVEVKAEGDRLTEPQQLYAKMAKAGGCIWIEAREVEQYFADLAKERDRILEGL
jgi:hypothetical protein